MKILIIIATLAIFLTKANSQNSNSNIPKLAKVDYGNERVIIYTYNEAGLIAVEKSKNFYRKYNYNELGQLSSIELYEDKTLISSNSEIARSGRNRTEWINPSNTEESYTTSFEYDQSGRLERSMDRFGVKKYHYDSKNRIASISFYYEGSEKNNITFEYDKKGNITKETNYSVLDNGEQVIFKEYSNKFDKKKNPYRLLRIDIIPGKFSNPNNITKSTCRVNVMKDEYETDIREAVYEYNDNDYPALKNGRITFIYE